MTLNHADSSHPISLNTAALLTGRSVRTWQRCIAEGQIPRLPDNRQQAAGALIPFEAVRPWVGRQDWSQEEVDLLVQADQGVAHAQAEIGAWFALAALQQAPESLHPPSGGAILYRLFTFFRRRQNGVKPMPCTGWACCIWPVSVRAMATRWR